MRGGGAEVDGIYVNQPWLRVTGRPVYKLDQPMRTAAGPDRWLPKYLYRKQLPAPVGPEVKLSPKEKRRRKKIEEEEAEAALAKRSMGSGLVRQVREMRGGP